MKYHKLADLFPLIHGDEFESLKKDIKLNGLNHPIIIYDEKILDGRNRFRACSETGVEPVFENYEGDKPLDYVISLELSMHYSLQSFHQLPTRKGQRYIYKHQI